MKRIGLAAAAVAVFAVLCWDSARRLKEAYPAADRCMDDPPKYVGKRVWIGPTRTISSGPESFRVQVRRRRVRVLSTLQPEVGHHVMVYGIFQSDGTVLAISNIVDPWYPEKRAGVFVLSAVALVIVGVAFRRTFAWRDGAFHPR